VLVDFFGVVRQLFCSTSYVAMQLSQNNFVCESVFINADPTNAEASVAHDETTAAAAAAT